MRCFLADNYRRSINRKISQYVVVHKASRPPSEIGPPQPLGPLPPPQKVVNNNITVENVEALYEAKCADLEVPFNEKAKNRFINQFMNGIKIKSLYLSGLSLGPSCIRLLIELIYRHPRYINLDLSLNRIRDKGASFLAQFLAIDPPVICVDLRSNAITSDGSSMIFKALTGNTHITTIDISAIDGIDRNRVGTQGATAIASVLKKNDILSSLTISMCGVSEEGCGFIGPALASNKSLLYLDLSANRVGTAGIKKLFAEDNSLGILETLNLSHNCIGDQAGPFISRQLAQNDTLRNLDLSSNNLTRAFLTNLFDAFQNGTKITSLSLANNKFGSESPDSFHFLLREYPSITKFNLSSNPLKNETIEQIAEAVRINTSIVHLDLSETLTGDDGAIKLAKALENHPSLTYLNLNENRITDKGGVPIANALLTNNVLMTLLMKNNEMKDDSSAAFQKALLTNKTITEIDLSFNDFSARAHCDLKISIKKHRENINANINEIAMKNIDKLKQNEQQLFQYRAQNIAEYSAVCNAKLERDSKKILLESIKIKRANELAECEKKREELRKEYEEINDKRRIKSNEFNEVKSKTEKSEADAQMLYQTIAQKRQHALSRLSRAEDKKLEATTNNSKVIEDLKIRLTSLKDQLKLALKEAHHAQDQIFAKEEAEKKARALQEEEEKLEREREEEKMREEEEKRKKEAMLIAKLMQKQQPNNQLQQNAVTQSTNQTNNQKNQQKKKGSSKTKNGSKAASKKKKKDGNVSISVPGNPENKKESEEKNKSALDELMSMTPKVNPTIGDSK